jgi:hypothetical protein
MGYSTVTVFDVQPGTRRQLAAASPLVLNVPYF